MKRIFFCGRYIALTLLLFVLATFAQSLKAQTQPLITTPVDESKLVTLTGSRPAALKGATDLGAADESQPSGRLMVTLKRSPEQETALQSFLLSAHQQSSPSYHKWLAPGEFGTRFGVADSDVQQVTGWMQAHGLAVAVLAVSDGDSILMAQKIASELGIGVGISSGCNLLAALIAQNLISPSATVVTVFCDDNKKYLTTDLLREEVVQPDYLSPDVKFVGFRSLPRCL
jgi:Pro-kumamolisin, activation domain